MSTTVQSDGRESGLTRRKTLTRIGTLVTAPSFVSVVSAQTSSGNVELTVDATIPAGTSASIRVFEDDDGNNTIDREQENTINDGTQTYEYDALQGFQGQATHYWMDIMLESDESGDATPEIHSVTITLPEDQPDDDDGDTGDGDAGADEQQGLSELWDNFLVFTTVIVMAVGAIGLASKSMAVASMGAYLAFAFIAVESGNAFLENILYVTLVLVMVGMSFKLWRLEGGGE